MTLGFTEGDYQSVLRKNDKASINFFKNDVDVFLLDFFPHDESWLNKLFAEDDNDSDSEVKDYAEAEQEESSDDEEKKKKYQNKFRVRVFGIAEYRQKHYSISIDLLDFKPYFFIKIPEHWNKYNLDKLVFQIKHEAEIDPKKRYPYQDTLVNHELVKAKPFYGYTADDIFQYAKLEFVNSSGWRNYKRLIYQLGKENEKYWGKFKLYESNIEPMLRLIHTQEMIPSGWIRIPSGKSVIPERDSSDCQLHLEVSYKDVISLKDKIDIPPIQYAGYDIEADSSHGDFPIAKKSYHKLAQDIVTEFLKLPQKNEHKLRGIIFTWLNLAFNNYYDNNNINRLITVKDEKPNEESINFLVDIIYEMGIKYHYYTFDLFDKGFAPDSEQTRQHLEYYFAQLQVHLEEHLPELDIERCKIGHYGLLAEQLLREVNRMINSNKYMFERDPKGMIAFMIRLAFDDFYDNHTINRVYNNDKEKPKGNTIKNLVPQVYQICRECYLHLNKPKEKKKSTPKIGPKKCMSEEPEAGQTKLKFLRKDANGNKKPITTTSRLDFSRRKRWKAGINRKNKKSSEELNSENDQSELNKIENEDQSNNKEETDNVKSEENKFEKEESLEIIKASDFIKKKNMREDQNERSDFFQKNRNAEEEKFFRGRYIKSRPEQVDDKPVKIGRDFYVSWLNELFEQFLPDVEGDPCIQIGTTFKRYGEKELFLKHIICLKGCAPFTNETLIDDENKDIYITKPKDAFSEAKKLNLKDPELFKIIQEKYDEAQKRGIKKPEIPELDELNYKIYIARRDRQMSQDHSVLRVECYDTEAQVLLAWRRLIKDADPDILVGYNIFGFDFKFMWERAEVLGVLDEFRDIGRIKRYEERLVEKKLVSSGLGDNLLYYMSMTGRVVIDLLKVVQSGNYRLPIYKLDFVCNHFMYKRKNDLPPQQLFVLQKGTDEDRATIAKYCIVDCLLCNRLIDKLEIITNNIGMSRVCKVPMSYLFLRGQGIKIQSLVTEITRGEGFLVPTKNPDDLKDEGGYEGAIVLEPSKDIYFEASVVADFNSLYPSCMIAWNLSHDSFVEIGGKYDNLPEGQYVDVEYDIYEEQLIPGRKTTRKVKTGVKVCRFYQPPDGTKSMLPRILQQLLKARKDTRQEQKKYPKGSFEWNVKEGLQLAYKVTANSLYGQVGSRTSAIFLKEIAACTTSCGRSLIYKSKKFFEENYDGCKCIYGDSVSGDTPLLIKNKITSLVTIKTIESLSDEWKPYEEFKPWDTNRREKQQTNPNDLQVWSDGCWANIRRVIRHKTQKKMYRVNSYQGVVDVTEDHSLLDERGEKITPGQCRSLQYIDIRGNLIKQLSYPYEECTSLLSSFPSEFPETRAMVPTYDTQNIITPKYPLTPEEAWVWGLFMADGNCKSSWAINSQDLNRLAKAVDILNEVEPKEIKFKIHYTITTTNESSYIYKLVTLKNENFKYMIMKYRHLFYDQEKYKVVPDCVLNAQREIRQAFFEGYHNSDMILASSEGKITMQSLFYLIKSLGYEDLTFVTHREKPDTYFLYVNENMEIGNKIRRIYELPSSDMDKFVYDIETSEGKFHGGVGMNVCSNTDSVFVKFNTTNYKGEKLYGLDSIYKSIELCTEGALAISNTLPSPHNLEFEKAIWPFMLLSKKRYHGHYYTKYSEPSFYPNSMGIVLKRRDNAEIVKHVFGGVIDIIMEEHDINKAMKFAKNESKKLLRGEFPLDMFTITKTLKSYYKNPDQIAHNVLAQRIAERDPGNKPQSNDRMAFAYIKLPEPKKGEKILQGNRIETPEFIKDNKLQLDYRFYLTNQVMKPVTQIFNLVMNEKELSGLFMEALIEYDRKMSGMESITKYVCPDSVEYRKRIDNMMKHILKEIEKDEEKELKYEQGDEVLFDTN